MIEFKISRNGITGDQNVEIYRDGYLLGTLEGRNEMLTINSKYIGMVEGFMKADSKIASQITIHLVPK